MNTALGNVLVMCAAVYSYLLSEGAVDCRVLDAGDDCCVIGEEETITQLAANLSKWFDRIGLIMKVEPIVTRLEHVSFCQTSPVYDGATWRMVRDPRVSCTKDACVLDPRHLGSNLKYYFHEIGTCGLALTGGLPVLQEYYTAMLRGTENHTSRRGRFNDLEDTGFFRLATRMHERYRVVTDEARASFAAAFGIVPDLQRELEAAYASLRVEDWPVALDEVPRQQI